MGKKDLKNQIHLHNTHQNQQAAVIQAQAALDLTEYKLWCRGQIAEGAQPEASDLDTLVKLYMGGFLIRCESSLTNGALTELLDHAKEAGLVPMDKPNHETYHLVQAKFLQALLEDEVWPTVLRHHLEHHTKHAGTKGLG